MGKKQNQLTAASDADAANDVKLLPLADPVSGESQKVTIEQIKKAMHTKSLKYVATGSEGVTVTLSALAGRDILLIVREAGITFPVDSSPDSTEFTWDDTDIVFGVATNPNERIVILHRSK